MQGAGLQSDEVYWVASFTEEALSPPADYSTRPTAPMATMSGQWLQRVPSPQKRVPVECGRQGTLRWSEIFSLTKRESLLNL